MKFYTYAKQWGNNILYCGYDKNRKVVEKVPFKPTLFVTSKDQNSEWKSFYTQSPLEPIKFESIKDAKDFVAQYNSVSEFDIHGFQKFEYQLIKDWFPGEINYDLSAIDIHTIDIEVVDEQGEEKFPDIQQADTPIVLISVHSSKTGKLIVFGLKDFNQTPEFEYRKFASEIELLNSFLRFHQTESPDVWTGWNIDGFDVPYMVNRIVRIMGEESAKRLSPFRMLREKMLEIRGKEVQTYEIFGLPTLDYLELYKKFGSYSQKESYALGFIAEEELGETKVDLPGSSFKDSYVNHTDVFIRYNAVDTLLVKKLEDKMKLIELAFALTYMYHVNLQDIYRTVLPWEVFIYNYLDGQKIVVPPKKSVGGEVEGAWVKEGMPGLYEWVMSFDFASLYPSTIRQWNISPETLVDSPWENRVSPNDFLADSESSKLAISYAKEGNLSLAANGTTYRKDIKGVLPALMEYCMVGRKKVKGEMLKLESEYEKTKNNELVGKISALDAKQMALKIAANAAYGACGNSGFTYYDYRIAEAITLSGQLCNRYLSDGLNKKFNDIVGTCDVDYVVYGDTDSLYLNCKPIIDKFIPTKSTSSIVKFLDEFGESVCQPAINKSVDFIFNKMNAYEKVIASKREAIASKMLFRAKKNYAVYVHNSEGVQYAQPKLKVKGLEIVRSSTPQWCRKHIKELLEMIMASTESKFRSRFAELEKEYLKLTPKEIAMNRGISDINSYFMNGRFIKTDRIPIHVRAAGLYNMHTSTLKGCQQIQNMDKIKFVYLKMPNPIRENVIGFPSSNDLPKGLGLDKYVDYQEQFDKTFEAPLKTLTDVAEWNLRETASLEDFF